MDKRYYLSILALVGISGLAWILGPGLGDPWDGTLVPAPSSPTDSSATRSAASTIDPAIPTAPATSPPTSTAASSWQDPEPARSYGGKLAVSGQGQSPATSPGDVESPDREPSRFSQQGQQGLSPLAANQSSRDRPPAAEPDGGEDGMMNEPLLGQAPGGLPLRPIASGRATLGNRPGHAPDDQSPDGSSPRSPRLPTFSMPNTQAGSRDSNPSEMTARDSTTQQREGRFDRPGGLSVDPAVADRRWADRAAGDANQPDSGYRSGPPGPHPAATDDQVPLLPQLPGGRSVLKPIVRLPAGQRPSADSSPPISLPQSQTPGRDLAPNRAPDRVGVLPDVPGGDPLFARMAQGADHWADPSDNPYRPPGRSAPVESGLQSQPASGPLGLSVPGATTGPPAAGPDRSGSGSTSRFRPPNTGPRPRVDYIWHVIGERQSLDAISFQYVGDGSLVPGIMALNRDILSDPNLLPIGRAIRIPLQ